MGTRHAVWVGVVTWWIAGCQCSGGGADAGRARDALAPCPEPVQLVAFRLADALTERYELIGLVDVATLGGQTLFLLSAIEEEVGPSGTTYARQVLALSDPERVLHEVETPAEGDAFQLVDVGGRAVVIGDGWTASYGPEGWGELQPPSPPAHACGGGHLAAMGPTIRIEDWSSGTPRPIAEGPAPDAAVLLDCVLHRDGALDLVFARYHDLVRPEESADVPLLVHVTPSGAFSSSPFGTTPIAAATFDGDDLFVSDLRRTGETTTTARVYRVEGGTARQLAERPSAYGLSDTGTVHPVSGGRLFVTSLVGFLWDGTTLGPPWPVSDLLARTDEESTWWVMEIPSFSGSTIGELRFCGDGS